MDTPESKNSKAKFELEKENQKFNIELSLKEKKLELSIIQENSIPSTVYSKEYSLEDLQKIAKYFKIFDLIEDVFEDFREKLSKKSYEINFEEIGETINIKIITNVFKSDFNLEIPLKKLEPETVIKDLCITIKKHDDEIQEILKIKEPEKKLYEKIEELEQKIKNLEEKINLQKKDRAEMILFEKSTIIKNDFERKMIESFININDTSKKEFVPNLLFKATVDGDKAEEFHKKCDYMGSTLTIVLSETGRRFGGYTSISWDKSKGNYCTEGINFLFSLDTRNYYKNTSGSYHTYHNSSYGPTFGGHDLYISNECLNKRHSYVAKNSYGTSANYELNGGTQYFKVLDYEVFQI